MKADTIDSTPPRLNWRVYVGDSNEEHFYIKDGDGNLLDVSSDSFLAQARPEPTSEVISLTATIDTSDAVNGHILVGWDGEAIRTLVDSTGTETWTGVWDLQVLKEGASLPRTYARGVFSATYDVTREP